MPRQAGNEGGRLLGLGYAERKRTRRRDDDPDQHGDAQASQLAGESAARNGVRQRRVRAAGG
jgi:hypothetical protein